jgi:alpha-methylacyl-CoA racemase
VNPRSVYCSTSGYGQTGPAAAWAGHDLNYLAAGGYLHTSGRGAGGKPPLPGATIADGAAGGMHAALSIVAALLARERTGAGCYLDVSVLEGVLSLMALSIDEHLATGAHPAPGHDVLTGRHAWYDTYRCRDGRWLAVAAIEPHFYRNLVKAIGQERWLTSQYDDAAQDAMRADFAAAFVTRDRDDWVAELAPADTCVAPVQTIEELAADPQLAARGAFGEAQDAAGRRFRQLAPPLAGMPRPSGPVRVRDASASDTDALLREAGLAPEKIEALRTSGVIA